MKNETNNFRNKNFCNEIRRMPPEIINNVLKDWVYRFGYDQRSGSKQCTI